MGGRETKTKGGCVLLFSSTVFLNAFRYVTSHSFIEQKESEIETKKGKRAPPSGNESGRRTEETATKLHLTSVIGGTIAQGEERMSGPRGVKIGRSEV